MSGFDDGLNLDELDLEQPELIRMIDVLGREQKEHGAGTLLFYIYDNGAVRRMYK